MPDFFDRLGAELTQAASTPRHLAPVAAQVRPVRRWSVLGAVGAALTAAIVATIALLSSGAPAAFANWSAVPAPVSPAALQAAIAKCYRVNSHSGALGQRVLSEARGKSTAAVFIKDGTVYMCRYDSAVPAVTQSSMGPIRVAPGPNQLSVPYIEEGGSSSSQLPKALAQKLKHRPLTRATELELREFNEGDGYGYWVLGRAGSAISSVSFAFADHPKVTATIQNGWYFAWWPWTSDPTSVSAATDSGPRTSKMKSSIPELGATPGCVAGTSSCLFVKTPRAARSRTSSGSADSTAAQECNASSLQSQALPANAYTGTPVISEVHGIYTALVHVTDNKLYGCFVGGDQKNRHGLYVLSNADFGRVQTPPPPGHISVPYTELTGGAGGRGLSASRSASAAQIEAVQQRLRGGGYGPYTLGRAANDVTAITFDFANGKTAAATVKNGWYLAWWPWISKPTSVRVTTSSGAVTSPLTSNLPRLDIVPGCQPGAGGCVFAKASH